MSIVRTHSRSDMFLIRNVACTPCILLIYAPRLTCTNCVYIILQQNHPEPFCIAGEHRTHHEPSTIHRRRRRHLVHHRSSLVRPGPVHSFSHSHSAFAPRHAGARGSLALDTRVRDASDANVTRVNEPNKSRVNVEELQRNRKVPQVLRYTRTHARGLATRAARAYIHIHHICAQVHDTHMWCAVCSRSH